MFTNVHKRLLRPRWRSAPFAGRPTFNTPKIDLKTPRGKEVSAHHDIPESAFADSHEQFLSPAQTANAAQDKPQIRGSARIDALDLAYLRDSDFLILRTSNSNYEFVVTNAIERIGWLAGGTYTEPRRAKLLGVSTEAGSSSFPYVRAGGRAVFLLEAVTTGSSRRLVTSPIASLSHYRFSARSVA
jgi:hypothetical protein